MAGEEGAVEVTVVASIIEATVVLAVEVVVELVAVAAGSIVKI